MVINNKLFVGMDLHKNTSTFSVKDEQGNVFKEAKVLTDRNQVREFMASLGNHPLSVVMEPVSQVVCLCRFNAIPWLRGAFSLSDEG